MSRSADAAGGDRVLTERDFELSRDNFLSARIKKATQRPKFAPGQLRARVSGISAGTFQVQIR